MIHNSAELLRVVWAGALLLCLHHALLLGVEHNITHVVAPIVGIWGFIITLIVPGCCGSGEGKKRKQFRTMTDDEESALMQRNYTKERSVGVPVPAPY